MSEAPAPSGTDSMDQIASILLGDDDTDNSSPDVVDDAPPEIDEAEADSDEGSSDEVEQEEGQEEQLAAFARELGVRPDQLDLDEDGQVLVKLKINGKTQSVPLQEAINATQYGKANEQKAQELTEKQRAFDAECNRVAQTWQARIDQVNALTNHYQAKILSDYQNIDWNRLRAENPAEWAARQKEFEIRAQDVQQLMNTAGEQAQQLQAEKEQELANQRQIYLNQQRSRMLDEIPEWRDPERMRSEINDIVASAVSIYGLDEDSVRAVDSVEHVKILRDAIAYRKGKAVAEKKVVNAPTMQRSTNGRFVSKQSKLDRLINRAKSAKGFNKKEAEADAVAALLLGGS